MSKLLIQNTINEFMDRTKNMFDQYYERAAVQDRLSGLTDQQISSFILDSPSKIKKRSDKLLKLLKKHDIKLNEDGSVYFGNCPSHLQKKLEQEPLVKITLMEKDLQFEFPHREY